jgi:hypothetical protein
MYHWLPFPKISRRAQRGLYWACACVADVSGFLMGYPSFKTGLGIAAILLSAMIFGAYAFTPYIKIGKKIYALTVDDSRSDPDDQPPAQTADRNFYPAPNSYSGLLTPTKMWWVFIGLALMATTGVYEFAVGKGHGWAVVVGAGLVVFCAAGAGYGDGSWGYRIARGQVCSVWRRFCCYRRELRTGLSDRVLHGPCLAVATRAIRGISSPPAAQAIALITAA